MTTIKAKTGLERCALSFTVPSTLWSGFQIQTTELFLARAPFLDHVIARELPHLRADLTGYRMSSAAKRHIGGERKKADAVSINLELRTTTAEELRAAVAHHNILRDAFLSRLLIFLRSTSGLLNYIEVPRVVSERSTWGGLEGMPTSPLLAMEAVRDDPLFYLRNYVQARHGVGLYVLDLPVIWACCYLEDSVVPGTRAFRTERRLLDQILDVPTKRLPRRPVAGRH